MSGYERTQTITAVENAILRDDARDGLWYLASPYALYPEGRNMAFIEASRAAAALIARGVPIFAPICHSHPFTEYSLDAVNLPHESWLALDEYFVKMAVGCIVLCIPGWQQSKGIAQELAWFKEAGKPIFYMDRP